jgi:zinc transporter ZupT
MGNDRLAYGVVEAVKASVASSAMIFSADAMWAASDVDLCPRRLRIGRDRPDLLLREEPLDVSLGHWMSGIRGSFMIERTNPVAFESHSSFESTVGLTSNPSSSLASRQRRASLRLSGLPRIGYLERRPDPTDRRTKLVVPTAAALELTTLVHAFNRRLEARYRRQLGADAYAAFRRSLETLAGRADAQPRIR